MHICTTREFSTVRVLLVRFAMCGPPVATLGLVCSYSHSVVQLFLILLLAAQPQLEGPPSFCLLWSWVLSSLDLGLGCFFFLAGNPEFCLSPARSSGKAERTRRGILLPASVVWLEGMTTVSKGLSYPFMEALSPWLSHPTLALLPYATGN